MRAVIDIGTNSTLLLIGSLDPTGKVRCEHQRFHVTRLGEGVHHTGMLSETAMRRTMKVLDEYDQQIKKYDSLTVHVVGTQALRIASNADVFIKQVNDCYQWNVHVISGDEEAKFSFLGALDAINTNNQEIIVVDVGGGSTEIISGTRDKINGFQSLPIGVVRAAELIDMKVTLNDTDRRSILKWTHQTLNTLNFTISTIDKMIGVGGTMTTLAAIQESMTEYDPEKVNGYIINRSALENLYDRLNKLSLEQRRQIPGLVRGREDVIVYGALVFLGLMDFAGNNEIIASDRGLRFGYLKWKEA